MKTRIFISAVSKELRSARQLVANTLLFLGYEPDWQEIFETSPEDIRPMLRRKINSCSAVFQIVGDAYGAEPREPDETFGRVSYTQYEALYAKARGIKVYYLIAEAGSLRDATADMIDLASDDSEAGRADAELRRNSQTEYRDAVKTSEHIFYPVQSLDEIALRIHNLKYDLIRLRWGYIWWMSGVSALLVLILLVASIDQYQQSVERGRQQRERLAQQMERDQQKKEREASEKARQRSQNVGDDNNDTTGSQYAKLVEVDLQPTLDLGEAAMKERFFQFDHPTDLKTLECLSTEWKVQPGKVYSMRFYAPDSNDTPSSASESNSSFAFPVTYAQFATEGVYFLRKGGTSNRTTSIVFHEPGERSIEFVTSEKTTAVKCLFKFYYNDVSGQENTAYRWRILTLEEVR